MTKADKRYVFGPCSLPYQIMVVSAYCLPAALDRITATISENIIMIASEPLTFEQKDWMEVKTNTMVVITPKVSPSPPCGRAVFCHNHGDIELIFNLGLHVADECPSSADCGKTPSRNGALSRRQF
jgi:hypothetical protein